jgi:hypothetical protein
MAGPSHRRWVNLLLAGLLAVLAIDAFHTVNDAHQVVRDGLNVPLVLTGLWQGPWRLYAPDVDKDNLRLKADLVFADQATATWSSPDWSQLSALQKFRFARHINYYNAILLADRQPAWDALCAYLARTVPHPEGKQVPVVQITLSLRGATIPPPDQRAVPAGPYLAFDAWQPIHDWKPGS